MITDKSTYSLRALFSGQIVWGIIILILFILFVYGETQAIRLFSGTQTENWKPSGPGSKNSNTHHK